MIKRLMTGGVCAWADTASTTEIGRTRMNDMIVFITDLLIFAGDHLLLVPPAILELNRD